MALTPKAPAGLCGACAFSNKGDSDELLECRRYPPLTHATVDGNNFPVVHPAAWCGEFQADAKPVRR